MFNALGASYLDYIDAAKVDSNSHHCTLSAQVKGIDHGNLYRHYEDYGNQKIAGAPVRYVAVRTAQADNPFEPARRCASAWGCSQGSGSADEVYGRKSAA
jgi:hypothetical protein